MDGTPLSEVLARVDRVRCGEAVTVFAPLADALAAAHAAGGAHGAIRADTVVVAPDGIPYLDVAPASGAPPPDDVRDLAVLLLAALVGLVGSVHPDGWADRAFALGVPAGLVTVLAAALAPEPERRPTAAEVATALRKTCDPLPLDRLLAGETPDDDAVGPRSAGLVEADPVGAGPVGAGPVSAGRSAEPLPPSDRGT